MATKESSNPERFKQTVSVISQLGALVTGVTVLIQLFVGDLPDVFYQQTLSAVSMLAFVVLLWLWRWPKITRKRGRTSRKTSLTFETLVKPFGDPDEKGYVLSIYRRRFEAVSLVLITIGLFVVIAGKTGRIGEELSGFRCSYAEAGDTPLLVISTFKDFTATRSAFEYRIYNQMYSEIGDKVSVCLGRDVIEVGSEVAAFAGRLKKNQTATIVVWGNSDDRSVVIHVTPVEWSGLPLVLEADAADAGEVEAWAKRYIPQIVLGWMQFLEGNDRAATHAIETTVKNLEAEPWAGNNEEALSRLYFLLAQLYMQNDLQNQAIEACTQVLRFDDEFDSARLARGVLYMDTEPEKAFADFNELIDRASPLAANAYVNRASLQPDWASQKNDLESAIDLVPDDPYYYQYLGWGALDAGDFETALAAYGEAREFLDEDTRAYFIDDLQAIAAEDGTLTEIVEQIIGLLNEPVR